MLNRINKIKVFLFEEIWRIRPDETSTRQFRLIKGLRILVLAVRRFIIDQCPVKASALTFFSLLSIVPIAAMAFGIAQGFGFRDALEKELQKRLVGHEEVVQYIQDFALEYLDNTKGGMIAGISLVVVLFAVMRLMYGVEESFNDIWDVKKSRSFIRKFSDYVSLVMIAILMLGTSSGVIVFISNSLRDIEMVSYAGNILLWVAPYIIIWLVFSLLFMIMPNTRVKPGAAFFGGIIAGSMFLLVQYGYVYFQIGVSRYNAIYGSFAALPLFLVWMQTSWMIVLFGAELSFAFQNEKSFEFEVDTRNMSNYTHRIVALLIVQDVVKAFDRGEALRSVGKLAENLRLPIRLVTDLVYKLFEAGVLVELEGDSKDDTLVLPAYDINKMDIVGILHRLDNTGYSETIIGKSESAETIKGKMDFYEKMLANSPENCLLKDL
jgi:membrane protein